MTPDTDNSERGAAREFFKRHAEWLAESWSMSPEGRQYRQQFEQHVAALASRPAVPQPVALSDERKPDGYFYEWPLAQGIYRSFNAYELSPDRLKPNAVPYFLAAASPQPGAEAEAKPTCWTPTETLKAGRTTNAAYMWFTDPHNSGWSPLYAHPPTPPAAQGLSEDQRDAALEVRRVFVQAAAKCREWLGGDCSGEPPRVSIASLCTLAEVSASSSLSLAALDVLAERRRQIEVEGWTPEHDDRDHPDGALSAAAAGYASEAAYAICDATHELTGPGEPDINDVAGSQPDPSIWPHGWTFKPAPPRRMLVKAGALILAEIERLDREASNKESRHRAAQSWIK